MIDQACTVLLEAGHSDPWEMTPRQIMHRLGVHNRVQDMQDQRDLELHLLAARGEKQHIEKFIKSRSEGIASPGSAPSSETIPQRAAKPAAARKAETELEKVGWNLVRT